MTDPRLQQLTRTGCRAGPAWLLGACLGLGCTFDRADRWQDEYRPPPPVCTVGTLRCHGGLERCASGPAGPRWVLVADCEAVGQVCSPTLLECAVCDPGSGHCDGQQALECEPDGGGYFFKRICDEQRAPCRNGACVDLCAEATQRRSNVGCEYWAVDLDNANVNATLNAAAQQFAVVVSNPQPDVPATVTVERDDTEPGEPGAPLLVASATLPPLSLRVFKLGPREVDGSAPGTYDTGTHTALTRHAYRLRASVPIIAYQFNPLENLNVFSNDASLLKPVEALNSSAGGLTRAYVALGWPQTIASTDDPNTNFNPARPVDLRAFLTIVGTRPETRVRLSSTVRVLGTSARGASQALLGRRGLPEVPAGGRLEVSLDAFDVLNLETDDFNADFTGSTIEADRPIVVFSGSEASDAPFFQTLAARRCCADHLEEQLDPTRTAGRLFVATVSPNRTRAVTEAGATLGVVEQPEYFRVIATTDEGARVRTTLADYPVIELPALGAYANLTASAHFMLESDRPIMLASVSPSQDAAGVPRGLPGGDPSFLVVPPVEQFRTNYVFLTPNKYAFDFVRIIAPPLTTIVFDNQALEDALTCRSAPGDGLDADESTALQPRFVVHTCQLSFPIVDVSDPEDPQAETGYQNDGVHRIEANQKIGLIVNGFDDYVSYAYAGGTELMRIAVE